MCVFRTKIAVNFARFSCKKRIKFSRFSCKNGVKFARFSHENCSKPNTFLCKNRVNFARFSREKRVKFTTIFGAKNVRKSCKVYTIFTRKSRKLCTFFARKLRAHTHTPTKFYDRLEKSRTCSLNSALSSPGQSCMLPPPCISAVGVAHTHRQPYRMLHQGFSLACITVMVGRHQKVI